MQYLIWSVGYLEIGQTEHMALTRWPKALIKKKSDLKELLMLTFSSQIKRCSYMKLEAIMSKQFLKLVRMNTGL